MQRRRHDIYFREKEDKFIDVGEIGTWIHGERQRAM